MLYASTVRDLLIELAKRRQVLNLLWSDAVHDEWTAALARQRRDLDSDRIARTRALVVAALPGAMVTGYQHRMSGLELPDPKDAHVLAAAIEGEAQFILTFNVGHFPQAVLARYNVAALNPDTFLEGLISSAPAPVVLAAALARGRMRKPEMTPEAYIAALARAQLPMTAAALAPFKAVL